VLLKNDNNNDNNNYSSFKSNNVCGVSANSNNNSLSNDWHKVKRRPVVANNEIEQELAMQISVANKKTADTSQNVSVLSQTQSQQTDLKNQQSSGNNNKLDSSSAIQERETSQSDIMQTKVDKSVEKDNDSEINLIKEQQQQREQSLNSNLIENYKENECDEESSEDNLSSQHKQSKRTKGNLKSQQLTAKGDRNVSGSCPLAVSRRVSFDPLALLLDAALEGELELVKKTANEVSF